VSYRNRRVGYVGLEPVEGWRLKLYGVAASAETIPAALGTAALNVAATALPAAPSRDAVGFVVAHESGSTSYVLVHWWAEKNEIHQRLFSCPTDRPSELRPHPSPAIGCVWELSVVDFERRAWLEHMLKVEPPDLERYLEATFDAIV
jgi:hypothetical protein